MLACCVAIITDTGNIDDSYLYLSFKEFTAETQKEAKERGLEKAQQSARRWRRSKCALVHLVIPIEGFQGNYLFSLNEDKFLTKKEILALTLKNAQEHWKQK